MFLNFQLCKDTDNFIVGSWDGHIRLWRVDPSLKSFAPLRTVDALGFINSLQIIRPPLQDSEKRDGKRPERDVLVVAAIGQEPKFGRWMTIKGGVRNGALVFSLTRDMPLNGNADEVVEEEVDE